MDILIKGISLLSNIFTISASAIAIYLFVAQRKSISTIFHFLLNYSYQLTLSELKERLERLNDYNAETQSGKKQIKNILGEIIGQIRGNDNLKGLWPQLLEEMEGLVSETIELTEPRKNTLVNELKERIRHLKIENINNIDDLVGES